MTTQEERMREVAAWAAETEVTFDAWRFGLWVSCLLLVAVVSMLAERLPPPSTWLAGCLAFNVPAFVGWTRARARVARLIKLTVYYGYLGVRWQLVGGWRAFYDRATGPHAPGSRIDAFAVRAGLGGDEFAHVRQVFRSEARRSWGFAVLGVGWLLLWVLAWYAHPPGPTEPGVIGVGFIGVAVGMGSHCVADCLWWTRVGRRQVATEWHESPDDVMRRLGYEWRSLFRWRRVKVYDRDTDRDGAG
jgi:hypothetical protein